jgi:DNA-binding transcriptional LysR family regulator
VIAACAADLGYHATMVTRSRDTARSSAPAETGTGKSLLPAGVSLRLLEIFVTVAEEGSMSTAAARLKSTQPAVSQAISTLEQSSGVVLFDRSVRPPALTLLGKAALENARAGLEQLRALDRIFRRGSDSQMPLLRIGMLNSLAATVGPYVIDGLRDTASRWSVASGFGATRMQSLLERKVDFIITSDESPVPSELAVLPIMTEPFFIALPRSFAGGFRTIRELSARLEKIHHGRESHMGPRIDRLLEQSGADRPYRYQLDTTDAAMRMVCAGFGWTIVTPLIFLKSTRRFEEARAVALPGRPLARQLAVVTRTGEAEIGERIRQASVTALAAMFLPEIRGVLPDFAAQIILHGGERGKSPARPRSRAAASGA